jgi:hypothetical protein
VKYFHSFFGWFLVEKSMKPIGPTTCSSFIKVWCDDELESYLDYKAKVNTLSHEITWEKVLIRTVKYFTLFENWSSTEVRVENYSLFSPGDIVLWILTTKGHSAQEYSLENFDNSGSQCTRIFTANNFAARVLRNQYRKVMCTLLAAKM